MANWSKEKCIQLISLYEKERVLWDPRDERYYDKNVKQDAWRRLGEGVGEDIKEVKNKMNNLLGSFRREKSREKKSLVTGSGADSRYISKWLFYEYFYFLADKYDPHDNFDTMESQESQPQTAGPSGSSQLSQPSPNAPSQPSQLQPLQNNPSSQSQESQRQTVGPSGSSQHSQHLPNAPSQPSQLQPLQNNPSSQSQPRRGYKRQADPMLREAMDILRKSSQQSDDPLITYGLHISNELRKHDAITIANVKHAINNILYQAEVGYYSYNPVQQYGYYTSYSSPRSFSRESNYSSVQSPAPPPPPTPPPPTPPPPTPPPPTPPPPTLPPPTPTPPTPTLPTPPAPPAREFSDNEYNNYLED